MFPTLKDLSPIHCQIVMLCCAGPVINNRCLQFPAKEYSYLVANGLIQKKGNVYKITEPGFLIGVEILRDNFPRHNPHIDLAGRTATELRAARAEYYRAAVWFRDVHEKMADQLDQVVDAYDFLIGKKEQQ
jgi:hypothetical protein